MDGPPFSEWMASYAWCLNSASPETLSGPGVRASRACAPRPCVRQSGPPLPAAVTLKSPLRIHLNNGFYSGKMFEECCSRALGPANPRRCLPLAAQITFRSQQSSHPNCFPCTQAKLNGTPSCIFYNLPGTGHFCFCLGYLVHKRQHLLLSEIPSISSKAVTPAWKNSSQESWMTFLGKIPEWQVGN